MVIERAACGEAARGLGNGEADLVCVVDARHGEPTPPLRQQQLVLDRVGQSLALIGAATVQGAQRGQPEPPLPEAGRSGRR